MGGVKYFFDMKLFDYSANFLYNCRSYIHLRANCAYARARNLLRRVRMSKVKSTVITVLLVLAIVVAAFFATISFPVGEIYRINSISSGIHLGADLSGYAYTTIYPEGVITAEDFSGLSEEDAAHYELIGGLYVDRAEYDDEELAALKEDVASDAKILNERYGKKGYSSYSVTVEDELSIRICVPTNFTYASYKGNDSSSHSSDLSTATAALTTICADGKITLRTTDSSIELTDASGNSTTYNPRKDDLYETALVDGSHTYSIAGTDDVSEYFESVSTITFGAATAVTLNFTEEGQESFAEVTSRAASSDSQTIYFFVGDTQVLTFECTSTVNQRSISLQATDKGAGENSAITLQSVIDGEVLSVDYESVSNVITSTATAGDNAAMWMAIGSLVVLAALIVASIIRYKRLGGVNSLIIIIFALVIVYALYLLSIQTTMAVVFCSFIGLALLMVSNGVVFTEVKRLVATGRTIQASIKEAYKNVLMTVTDTHIVLVVVSILLAAVGVGEVAACGLIMVVATVASYVLYWFTRLMWYVLSAPVRDKFAFAGLKRVVYEDD